VEVGASWTAAVAAMAATVVVEETEEGKCDREFLPSKGKRAMARKKESQHQRQHKRMLQNRTQHGRDEKEEEEEKEKKGGQGWVQG